MALAVQAAYQQPVPRLVFAKPPPGIAAVARELGLALREGGEATELVREALRPLGRQGDILKALSFSRLGGDLTAYLGGEAPSPRLLTKMGREAPMLRLALDALSSRTVRAEDVLRILVRGDRRRVAHRIALTDMLRRALADSGPQLGAQPRARVRVDFDNTWFDGDTHNALIGHALQTRPRVIMNLSHPLQRLAAAVHMAYLYKRHRLLAPQAAQQVGELLAGVPVIPVAREWASAAARDGLKRGVMDLTFRRARRIVAEEWEAEGRTGPVQDAGEDSRIYEARLLQYEREMDAEARSRIDIFSSQFEVVLRMLTDVGDRHENLLGIPRDNVFGSRGTFDDQGRFVLDDQFLYCFGDNKLQVALEADAARVLVSNPERDVTLTDSSYYDGPLLLRARPANRIIVDPRPVDAAYVRTWETDFSVDQWDESSEGSFGLPPGTEGAVAAGKRGKLRFDLRRRFFPDSRTNLSRWDAWRRALFGMMDMVPATLMELLLHRKEVAEMPVMAAMPVAAGLLYGPLNRKPMTHVLVGALVAGGLSVAHTGELRVLPVIVGGGSLAAAHVLGNRTHFHRKARRLGPEGYSRPAVRFMNLLERMGVTGLWAGLTRLLGLTG